MFAALNVRTKLSSDPPAPSCNVTSVPAGESKLTRRSPIQVCDISTDTSTLPTRPELVATSPRSIPCAGASGIGVPGASWRSSGATAEGTIETSSDHRLSRPVSADARSCTVNCQAPWTLRPRSVASAGTVVSSKVTFKSSAFPPRPFGCSSITAPHGVVRVTRRSPRKVCAMSTPTLRLEMFDASVTVIVSLMPAVLLSGIGRLGVDTGFSVCGGSTYVRQQATKRHRRSRGGDLVDRQVGRSAVPPFAAGHRAIGKPCARSGIEVVRIAHQILLLLELKLSIGLFQRQLVVVGVGHLFVTVVALLVDVPDRQSRIGKCLVAARLLAVFDQEVLAPVARVDGEVVAACGKRYRLAMFQGE